MNKKLKIKTLIIIIIVFASLIYTSLLVEAIGITPGRKTIDFQPNLKTSVQFSIINNEKKAMGVVVYVEGELKYSITLHDTLVEFKENEDSKSFTYDVQLPNQLKEPGVYETRIVAREIPITEKNQGSFVGATSAVVSQLHVLVPYPGKYAKAELKVSDNDGGKPVKFFVALSNLGEQNIVNAKAVIDIFGANNQKITTITTNTKSIDSKQRDDLYAVWDSKSINIGKYYAKATITYDGKVTESNLVFDVGQLLLEIFSIEVNNFKFGGIAKFDILLENKWNEDLKNVYAEISLLDQKGNEIVKFKSANGEIKTNSKGKLIAFWDTGGFKEGIYNGKISVYYNDQVAEKQLRTVISLNSIKTDFVGISAEVVGVKSNLNNQGLLIFLVVILIVGNIAWFVYFKKRVKK